MNQYKRYFENDTGYGDTEFDVGQKVCYVSHEHIIGEIISAKIKERTRHGDILSYRVKWQGGTITTESPDDLQEAKGE